MKLFVSQNHLAMKLRFVQDDSIEHKFYLLQKKSFFNKTALLVLYRTKYEESLSFSIELLIKK